MFAAELSNTANIYRTRTRVEEMHLRYHIIASEGGRLQALFSLSRAWRGNTPKVASRPMDVLNWTDPIILRAQEDDVIVHVKMHHSPPMGLGIHTTRNVTCVTIITYHETVQTPPRLKVAACCLQAGVSQPQSILA